MSRTKESEIQLFCLKSVDLNTIIYQVEEKYKLKYIQNNFHIFSINVVINL
jgi:hypothetical protein